MKTYSQLIEECLDTVEEVFPWDLEEELQSDNKPLLLDIREPEEFNAMRLKDSMNVPRGVLEQSCEWDFEETIPDLVQARDKPIVVICRSGNRSVLAAYNNNQEIDIDDADEYFASKVKPEQMRPK
ncbi:MAG: hypothetical protein AMJ55_01155 [Gammaproteobacteria bacterium SG8_15]|nr:MAG: hypothetical protein AMJ55_01155 [Gammaproteobacteria bacterium SG8_15]